MIPVSDEAVEAAAEAIFAQVDVIQTPEYAAEIARMVLEAAAPYIAAEAWDEGEQAGAMNHAAEEYPEVKDTPNPYRSQA